MKRIILGHDKLVGELVAKATHGEYMPTEYAIGLAKDNEIIAGVLYNGYNIATICMHVAAVGKHWLNRDFLYACFAYPFLQLKVNKVLGYVNSLNLEAQRFDEHLGFVKECAIKDGAPGADLIVYSMTKAQCRWIDAKYKERIAWAA
jgi:RimJ/RimL family protein N-acetyltransferase